MAGGPSETVTSGSRVNVFRVFVNCDCRFCHAASKSKRTFELSFIGGSFSCALAVGPIRESKVTQTASVRSIIYMPSISRHTSVLSALVQLVRHRAMWATTVRQGCQY